MHWVCVAKVGMHAAQLKMACKGMVGIDEQNSSSHQGSRGLAGEARGGDVLCGIVADGVVKPYWGTRAGLFSTQRVNVSRRLRMKCKREKWEAPRTICDIPSYTTELESLKRVRSVAALRSTWKT